MKNVFRVAATLLVAYCAYHVGAGEDNTEESASAKSSELIEVAEKCAQLWSESGWAKQDWLHWLAGSTTSGNSGPHVSTRDPTSLLRLGIMIDPVGDAQVIDVLPQSNAHEAGIQRLDVIQQIGRIDLTDSNVDPHALPEYFQGIDPNDSVTISVLRNGEPLTFDVTNEGAEVRKGEFEVETLSGVSHMGEFASLGIILHPMLDDALDELMVLAVVPNSGAAAAGIRHGDVIEGIDSIDLGNDELAVESLKNHMASLTPGDSVGLRILRHGNPMDVEVTTKPHHVRWAKTLASHNSALAHKASLGVLIEQDADGVRVLDVLADGGADEAGIQMRDIIQGIDTINTQGQPLTSEALSNYVSTLTPGDTVALTIQRNGTPMEIQVTTKSSDGIARLRNSITSHLAHLMDDPVFVDEIRRDSNVDENVKVIVSGSALQSGYFDGNQFTNIDADLGAYFGVEEGVLVLNASKTGEFKSGDILKTIDGEVVESSAHALKRLSSLKQPAFVSVIRDGIEISLQVEPQTRAPIVRSIRKQIEVERSK